MAIFLHMGLSKSIKARIRASEGFWKAFVEDKREVIMANKTYRLSLIIQHPIAL